MNIDIETDKMNLIKPGEYQLADDIEFCPSPPTNVVKIEDPTGTGASAVGIFSGGCLRRVLVLHGGCGYTPTPSVIVESTTTGAGAEVTAQVTAGVIISFTVVEFGSGYASTVIAPITILASNVTLIQFLTGGSLLHSGINNSDDEMDKEECHIITTTKPVDLLHPVVDSTMVFRMPTALERKTLLKNVADQRAYYQEQLKQGIEIANDVTIESIVQELDQQETALIEYKEKRWLIPLDDGSNVQSVEEALSGLIQDTFEFREVMQHRELLYNHPWINK